MDAFWRRIEKLFDEPSDAALKSDPSERRRIHVDLGVGDVVICGWPKTGTTWLQQILHQLRTGGDESFADIYSISKYIPFHFEMLPKFDAASPAQPWKPRIFKNHDCYEWRPQGMGVKYIAITRDPLDVVWSYAKYIARYIGGIDEDLDADGIVRILKSPLWRSAGTYHAWMLSWFPHRNDADVLWLHYEDLQENLPFCVRKIAAFVGVPLTSTLEGIVAEHSSFDYMLRHKEKFKGDAGIAEAMKHAMQEEWTPAIGMVRGGGGTVGQGAKEITPEVRKWLADEWESTINKTLGFQNYAGLRAQSSLVRSSDLN